MMQQSGSPDKVPAVEHWWTVSEWGADRRTGARVYNIERPRRDGDPGKHYTVWDWRVYLGNEIKGDGTARDQGASRAAIRKVVRALPDKVITPSCGHAPGD